MHKIGEIRKWNPSVQNQRKKKKLMALSKFLKKRSMKSWNSFKEIKKLMQRSLFFYIINIQMSKSIN
jgi:hypothetical protein